MNLRSSDGWRRLGRTVLIVCAPIVLGIVGFAIFNIQGFMHSAWALWVLLACIFIPYSILYTADMLRRREARRGEDPAGDSSPLVFVGGSGRQAGAQRETSSSDGASHSGTTWMWVGLVLVSAYAVFRMVWALANGAVFDGTAVLALLAAAVLGAILPSAIGWQRFRRSVIGIGEPAVAWPTLRTDQFAAELHHSRPGVTIPQDLIVAASEAAVSVWTTEREPRLLVSLPRDATTTIRSVTLTDRLGSTGIRIEHHDGGDSYAFELVVRRKGTFTYFRTDQATAQSCADELASVLPGVRKL